MTVSQNASLDAAESFSAAGSVVTHRDDEGTSASLQVAVAEARMARELGQPVKLARVFALVPRFAGDELEWDRHALYYAGSKRSSDGALRPGTASRHGPRAEVVCNQGRLAS